MKKILMGLVAGAALSVALIAGGPVSAQDVTAMTDAERQAFRDEVRAYLLENPEVLMEAIAVLEKRQNEAQAAGDVALVRANSEAIFNDGYSFVGGNPDGDITLVEFLDYRCGYCKKAFPEVNSLIESDGNIRFIVKEFPILGEQSMLAARFAIATLNTHGPETYQTLHDAMMAFGGEINEAALARLARSAGFDAATVMDRLNDDAVTEVIARNRALAQRLQINGTPGFVLGETMLRGYLPQDAMARIVAEERGS